MEKMSSLYHESEPLRPTKGAVGAQAEAYLKIQDCPPGGKRSDLGEGCVGPR